MSDFILGGGTEPEQAMDISYGQGAKTLSAVNRPPTLEEQLVDAIARTEIRLESMKGALEVLRKTPDYETLFKGVNALHRNF